MGHGRFITDKTSRSTAREIAFYSWGETSTTPTIPLFNIFHMAEIAIPMAPAEWKAPRGPDPRPLSICIRQMSSIW